MSMNRMLMNINRNARRVDGYYSQISTGKKIQNPSDNPIIASRALKFRTNISDTEQYARNAAQAQSWMSITEEGFDNTLEILEKMRSRFVQGATDTLTPEDRDKIVEEIRTFAQQIGGEMNVAYAGRYVLSGYRTDQPPTMTKTEFNNVYTITQELNLNDIQETKAYVRDETPPPPAVITIHEINKIDLPYHNEEAAMGNPARTVTMNLGNIPGGVVVVAGDDPDRYVAPAAGAKFIAETGELILSDATAAEMRANPEEDYNVVYTINGLYEGEPNPIVYFECTQTNVADGTSKNFNMEDQHMQFEFGINTRIQVNNLAKDVYTPSLYAELMNFCDLVSQVRISTDAELRAAYAGLGLDEDVLKQMVDDQIVLETKKFTDYLQDSFSAMLGRYEVHSAAALKEFTTLGSRINRIELTSSRLEENRVSYTELMSENENVDYMEVIMNLSAMEAVYSASMMAGSRISQMSLADYVR
jgi:flagellar hook-associated protein 3 FlgL